LRADCCFNLYGSPHWCNIGHFYLVLCWRIFVSDILKSFLPNNNQTTISQDFLPVISKWMNEWMKISLSLSLSLSLPLSLSLFSYWGLNLGLAHARQALCYLSHTPTVWVIFSPEANSQYLSLFI
jgi:hypothetical protein